MKCLKTILYSVGMMFLCVGGMFAALGVAGLAAYYSNQFFELDKQFAGAFFGFYVILALGIFIGVIQCVHERS